MKKTEPHVIAETSSFLVVYKPPLMHTAPLQPEENSTLLAWIALRFPEVLNITGRKNVEGGLVHRLDYETQGLVLCARTQAAMNILLSQQEQGKIVKEYEACCNTENSFTLPGFPLLPPEYKSFLEGVTDSNKMPAVIESAFRPYGKGRKAVRPIQAENCRRNTEELYRTEILSCARTGKKCFFKLRITKGFRHQIRCHLAWIGRPIENDSLYGNAGEQGCLALRSTGISFYENGARQYITC